MAEGERLIGHQTRFSYTNLLRSDGYIYESSIDERKDRPRHNGLFSADMDTHKKEPDGCSCAPLVLYKR
jgi:hypothetical protein